MARGRVRSRRTGLGERALLLVHSCRAGIRSSGPLTAQALVERVRPVTDIILRMWSAGDDSWRQTRRGLRPNLVMFPMSLRSRLCTPDPTPRPPLDRSWLTAEELGCRVTRPSFFTWKLDAPPGCPQCASLFSVSAAFGSVDPSFWDPGQGAGQRQPRALAPRICRRLADFPLW